MAAAPVRYRFGEFELDPQARRLTRAGAVLAIPDRHFEILHQLVAHPGAILSKNRLVEAAWRDVAVTDNSLEQAVSALRRVLGAVATANGPIETVPRQGYRFSAVVEREAGRESDAALDALLAPHRAWLEGRAALETLELEQITRARAVFERVLEGMPDQALPHIGLANACALQFETTRIDAAPDRAALDAATRHAREACRLDPDSAEAWATLGFVLGRAGGGLDALAALRRAVSLEPDNWRHHFRLSYAAWGEERLRAARRTLALLPGFPLARWMAATVHVARNVLDEAERELAAGIAVQETQGTHARFSAVALHWLRGLVALARGDEPAALQALERELSFESTGHLYARECCANTWYAIGAVHLRQSRFADARLAFTRALERVPAHALARTVLAALSETEGTPPREGPGGTDEHGSRREPNRENDHHVDAAVHAAVVLVLRGQHAEASAVVDRALAAAPAGSAGWLLPVEPLLHVTAREDAWAAPLARLRARAT